MVKGPLAVLKASKQTKWRTPLRLPEPRQSQTWKTEKLHILLLEIFSVLQHRSGLLAPSGKRRTRTNLPVVLPRPQSTDRAADAAAAAHGPAGRAAAGPVVEEQPVPLVGRELEGEGARLTHFPRLQRLQRGIH